METETTQKGVGEAQNYDHEENDERRTHEETKKGIANDRMQSKNTMIPSGSSEQPQQQYEEPISSIVYTSEQKFLAKATSETTTSDTNGTEFPRSLGAGCDVTEPIKRVLCSENNVVNIETLDNGVDDGDDPMLDEATTDSNISDPSRRIWVVTTAALPWMTGTAVNPLLRALYLTRGRQKHFVTLMIPWVTEVTARAKLYGKDGGFASEAQQEAYIRRFSRERAHCADEEPNLRIMFYDAMLVEGFGSIFPSVDICSLVPDGEADICILEEPEHLNWFRVPAKDATAKSTEKVIADAIDGVEPPIADEVIHDKHELGWAHKFRHSVGILHTNYEAYMTQYAIGTSFIAAPAIGQLSSIVVRAYCHKVIRLSAVLPSLAPNKEVTCNVHGVRSEFLDTPAQEMTNQRLLSSPGSFARVYFIGKTIWAKGFDKLLELQDLFRKDSGDFFPIDIYGTGSDEVAISRAFFGRSGRLEEKKTEEVEEPLSATDIQAAALFERQESLRKVVSQSEDTVVAEPMERTAVEVTRSSCGKIETVRSMDDYNDDDDEAEVKVSGKPSEKSPVSILTDLTSRSIGIGFSTSQAVYNLSERIVKAGHKMTFSEARKEKATMTKSFFFDPPKSTYEWRKYPIPARFLGRHDHILLRDIPATKVFLNMSTTEVLCTTSAEALAMGKFVILPKHPSNEFFYQFPNCLAYESVTDCIDKVKFAVENDPAPLSEELKHRFTWEGANDRLVNAAKITKRELQQRRISGMEKSDNEVARFHVSTAKKGHLITSFLTSIRAPPIALDPTESVSIDRTEDLCA